MWERTLCVVNTMRAGAGSTCWLFTISTKQRVPVQINMYTHPVPSSFRGTHIESHRNKLYGSAIQSEAIQKNCVHPIRPIHLFFTIPYHIIDGSPATINTHHHCIFFLPHFSIPYRNPSKVKPPQKPPKSVYHRTIPPYLFSHENICIRRHQCQHRI